MAKGLKKRVLIVEDSLDLQMLLATLLRKEGFEPLKASNGRDALELLRSTTELPALILLDVMMPVMDGYEFRRAQQADPRLSQIPVVVMTAHAQSDVNIGDLRARDFLRKPIDVQRLLEVAAQLSA